MAILDSVIDKVSEIIIFIGILIGNFTNPVLVLVTLSLAILVSYTRARGEAIGVDLKGKGIAERAERILILSILAFIPFKDNISVALWIISILAIITVLERLKIVSRNVWDPSFLKSNIQTNISKRRYDKSEIIHYQHLIFLIQPQFNNRPPPSSSAYNPSTNRQ